MSRESGIVSLSQADSFDEVSKNLAMTDVKIILID